MKEFLNVKALFTYIMIIFFDSKKWREYTRNYSLIDYSIVFPNNIKSLLKNTQYKYSCIWDLVKHSTYINLLKLFKNTSELIRVEILTRMKLYNLAANAGEFKSSGSFQEIFGVSKDYYKFMKRHNITYTQLEILKLLKQKNIKKIKYLEKFLSYGENTRDLEEISKYISLDRFIKYAKMHRGKVKTYIYKDYLRFAKALGFDLKNSRYAFPKDLKKEHDILEKQYEIKSKELINKAIVNRAKKLKQNIYQDKKFIIFPAPKLDALIDESSQQHNCVRTYAEKYAKGECDIYFMRDIKNKKKSLVTVEVVENEVIQSRTKYNENTNKIQDKFLHSWEQEVLKGAA